MTQTFSMAAAKEAWAQRRFLDCGRALYEPLKPAARVDWATALLTFSMRYSPTAPVIDRLVELARVSSDWRLAHAAFGDVRKMTLVAEGRGGSIHPRLKNLLYVAENTAKVIYNASNEPAPFDHDAGWWVVPCFEHFLATVAEAAATNGGHQLLFGDD